MEVVGVGVTIVPRPVCLILLAPPSNLKTKKTTPPSTINSKSAKPTVNLNCLLPNFIFLPIKKMYFSAFQYVLLVGTIQATDLVLDKWQYYQMRPRLRSKYYHFQQKGKLYQL